MLRRRLARPALVAAAEEALLVAAMEPSRHAVLRDIIF